MPALPPMPRVASITVRVLDPVPWITHLSALGFTAGPAFQADGFGDYSAVHHEMRCGRTVVFVAEELPGSAGRSEVRSRGDHVSDVALAVADVPAVFDRATGPGRMRPLTHAWWHHGPDGTWAPYRIVEGPAGLSHSLYQGAAAGAGSAGDSSPDTVTHITIAVRPGDFAATAAMYTEGLGLHFDHHRRGTGGGGPVIDSGGLRGGSLTLTLLAATHGPAGVRHVTIGSAQLTEDRVQHAEQRGIRFTADFQGAAPGHGPSTGAIFVELLQGPAAPATVPVVPAETG